MSTTSTPPISAPTRRGPRIWLRLLILLVLVIAAPFLFYLFDRFWVEWALRAAWAEADRTDPGWRYEELQAKREVIPDDENGALQVLKALQHLPKGGYLPRWKKIEPEGEWSRDELARWRSDFENALYDQPPNTSLNAQQILGLAGEVEDWKAAIDELHRLVPYSKGRYPPTGTKAFPFPSEISASRSLVYLLGWEVRIQAHRQKWHSSVAACRAAFTLTRCIGDEPTTAAELVRISHASIAPAYVETLLAQGRPPAELLVALQQDVRFEAEQSHFFWCARADRSDLHRMFRQIAAGELSREELESAKNLARMIMTPRNGNDWLNAPAEKNWFSRLREQFGLDMDWKRWETEAMQSSNAWVAIAKLPMRDQFAAYKIQRGQSTEQRSFSTAHGLARASFRVIAKLRTTEAALALERYRQDLGRWPDKLDELAPRYLDKVPIDFFTGQQLRYRQLADGVAVYSVGLDEQDNGGKFQFLANEIPGGELQTGLDIGIRLWDPDKRRAPPLPPPKRDPPDEF